MASQAVTGSQDVAVLEFRSFVRGYHVYQTTWDPNLGDVLASNESLPIARIKLLLLTGALWLDIFPTT